jgi:hypothetical protein
MATLDALAITQLMFDLCSAPCKARRVAPTALTHPNAAAALGGPGASGLRALTVPARRSRLGDYVMADGVMPLEWTDLDKS